MLHAERLTIAVGTRTLCRELDLAVAPGELWAVLGCNGSGKTTLLHALAGLAPARAGRVSVAGKPLADYSRRSLRRTLGVLLQREDQEFWGSLADYVMLGRYPHARSLFGWDASDEEAAARAIFAFSPRSRVGSFRSRRSRATPPTPRRTPFPLRFEPQGSVSKSRPWSTPAP